MAETAEAVLGTAPETPEPTAPETPAPEPTADAPAPQEGTEQPQQPDWLERMEGRFNELRSDLGIELPEQPEEPATVQSAPQSTQPEPEPGEEEYAFGDPDLDPDAQAQIQSYLDRKAEEAADRRLKPFFEQENTRRRVEAAMALEEQFPELREPRVAQPIVQMAHGLLNEMGVAQAASHPASVKLVQLIYLASKAEAAASSETPAGEAREVALEQPGARAPGGTGELTEAQSVVAAGGNGLSFLR